MGEYVFKPRHTVFGGIIGFPGDFKIRNKEDVRYFIDKVVKPGIEIVVTVDRDIEIRFSKGRNNSGNALSVGYRSGNLRDPFNPVTEVANNTTKGCYKHTVEYYVWKWRKYLNCTLFGRDE